MISTLSKRAFMGGMSAAMLALAVSGCTTSGNAAGADLIISGGPILTMDGDTPTYVEAVVVNDGKIVFTGSSAEAMKQKASGTIMKDLGGKTMLPGFVDAHGHFINAPGLAKQVNVSAPPVGKGDSITGIIAALKAHQATVNEPDGGWIIGYGYDGTQLKEGRELNRTDLDAAFPNHKVMIFHVSLHGAVLNSKAFEWAKVTKDTPTPAGGVIAREADGKTPAGLVMETAFLPIFSSLPKPNEAELLELLKPGQMMYAENGYTVAVDGFTHEPDLRFLQKAAAGKRLFIDVVVLPGFTEMPMVVGKPEFQFGVWNNRLKLQGIKITQDGSPQGKTAYVTTPFLTGGPLGQKAWRGETTQSYDDFAKTVAAVHKAGLQLFIHANGDATIDQAIKAVEAVGITAAGDPRVQVIHSQFQRPDHLPKYKALGMTPSYFTNHTFFWGDVHRQNIGEAKAAFISPMKAASDLGLHPSNHTDFNVTPLDPMFVLWSSMARMTRTGFALGPDQRIDAYLGLKGLTINAAWQFREEGNRGSIAKGKRADFVILSGDPVKTDVSKIRDIRIVETIKDGKTIFPAS